MTRDEYDVVIVGARCAGASLATFLARGGASVLVLDQAALPSDQVLSTHALHPAGLEVLEELGLADALRKECPESRVMRIQRGAAYADVRFAEGRGEYCPRRTFFDALLQDAAQDAGATLSDRTKLTGLVEDASRVTGVRLRTPSGERTIRAGLVVGADGRDSAVANAVGAEEYLGYDAARACYWGYFPAPPGFGRSAEHPFGMYVGQTDDYLRVIFHTEDDRIVLGCLPPVEEVSLWKPAPLDRLRSVLSLDPATRSLVAAEPSEKIRGIVSCRYFFRRAVGPGWMLVGDAGVHKEFITGDGMSEALIQARNGARAILRGTESALEIFWRERDVLALPMYYFGKLQGGLGRPPRLEEVLFEHAHRDPVLQARLAEMLEHRRSPLELATLGQIVPWMLAAAVRGEPRVLAEFLRQGRIGIEIAREMAVRQRLLDEARSGSAATPS